MDCWYQINFKVRTAIYMLQTWILLYVILASIHFFIDHARRGDGLYDNQWTNIWHARLHNDELYDIRWSDIYGTMMQNFWWKVLGSSLLFPFLYPYYAGKVYQHNATSGKCANCHGRPTEGCSDESSPTRTGCSQCHGGLQNVHVIYHDWSSWSYVWPRMNCEVCIASPRFRYRDSRYRIGPITLSCGPWTDCFRHSIFTE
jgi:hypothetical protein